MKKEINGLSFPILYYPARHPIEFSDPMIAKLTMLKSKSDFIEISQLYSSVMTKKKVMYHMDKLVTQGVLEKEILSPRKHIYRISSKQTYENLQAAHHVENLITLFPQAIHSLPFFNPKRLVMQPSDFTKRITASFSSVTINRWFPNHDMSTNDFLINMKSPKGTLTTISYLKVLIVVQSMMYQAYKAKLLAQELYDNIDYTDKKQLLLTFNLKVSDIVEVFDKNKSKFYIDLVIEALTHLQNVILRIPKEYYDHSADYIGNHNPYALGFPDNYKLIHSFQCDNELSAKTIISIRLNNYYADYFDYLHALEEEDELALVSAHQLISYNDITAKIHIMLYNLIQLKAHGPIRVRAFFKLLLLDRHVATKTQLQKLNKALQDYMLGHTTSIHDESSMTYSIKIKNYNVIYNVKEQNIHLNKKVML